jgi:hypothetical protein
MPCASTEAEWPEIPMVSAQQCASRTKGDDETDDAIQLSRVDRSQVKHVKGRVFTLHRMETESGAEPSKSSGMTLRVGASEKPGFEQDLLESHSSFNHREKNPEVLSRLSHQAGVMKISI